MNSSQLDSDFTYSTPTLREIVAKLFFVMGILHIYSALKARVIRRTLLFKAMLQEHLKVGVIAFSVAGLCELLLS